MSFTDDDLKQLKEYILKQEKLTSMEPDSLWISHVFVKNLLARLKWAELFIFDPKKDMDECGWCIAEENDDNTLTHQHDCELNLAYEAWRESAGKE